MPATAEQIARINELSGLARTAWFTLLGYLVFVGITLLGVRDADFFVPSRQTDLPLVGVSVPTASFFWLAPILAAALYTYLHLFLIKLWDAHAEARTADADPTHHWLVGDFVLLRQHDPTTRTRPLSWLVTPITLLLVWSAAPIVLAYAWWRSMPAHNPWLTLLVAACLWLTLVVGATSWWRAEERLQHRRPPRWLRESRLPLAGLLAVALAATGALRSNGGSIASPDAGVIIRTFSLASADLAGATLVSLPDDWRSPEVARKAFRVTWCQREALPMLVCDQLYEVGRPPPLHLQQERQAWCARYGATDAAACQRLFDSYDDRFDREWREERYSQISALDHLDLREADLRSAWAPALSAAGSDLGGADLRQAMLWGANLEGTGLGSADLVLANLQQANLIGSGLYDARLQHARLDEARLDQAGLAGANLSRASLLRAELGRANLEDAALVRADLQWANFERAWMVDSDLSGSILVGTILWGARLDRASLVSAQGNGDFRFASLLGADWRGAELAGAAHGADLRGARHLTQAQLDRFIGDAETLLPDGLAPDTGQPFRIWTCWSQPPAGLDAVLSEMARLRGSEEEKNAFRSAALCTQDHPRLPTGRTCAADIAREACLSPTE